MATIKKNNSVPAVIDEWVSVHDLGPKLGGNYEFAEARVRAARVETAARWDGTVCVRSADAVKLVADYAAESAKNRSLNERYQSYLTARRVEIERRAKRERDELIAAQRAEFERQREADRLKRQADAEKLARERFEREGSPMSLSEFAEEFGEDGEYIAEEIPLKGIGDPSKVFERVLKTAYGNVTFGEDN